MDGPSAGQSILRHTRRIDGQEYTVIVKRDHSQFKSTETITKMTPTEVSSFKEKWGVVQKAFSLPVCNPQKMTEDEIEEPMNEAKPEKAKRVEKDKVKSFLLKACQVGWKIFKFVSMVALYTAVQAFLMTHVGIIVPSLEFFMDRLYELSKKFVKWLKNKVCIEDKLANLKKKKEEKSSDAQVPKRKLKDTPTLVPA